MAGSPIVAFLSAGRCGTGWLAAGLREYHPQLEVEHEPIGPLYSPRRFFRCYDDPGRMLEVDEVRRHLRRIERTTRPYVETGWPMFSALPLLADLLPERLRIVHLTRHPVPSALAHLARGTFAGSTRDDAYTRLATLGPDDPNVFQPEYALTWEKLSPYERSLFWWTEVHLYGLEFPGRYDSVPFIRVKAEDLLAGDRTALERLLEFIGADWDQRWIMHAADAADRWQLVPDQDVDPLEIHRHPVAAEVARALGYDIAQLNRGALEERLRGVDEPAGDRTRR